MSKIGRPRKPIDDLAQRLVRKYWRETSAKYYQNHREEILERARIKTEEMIE